MSQKQFATRYQETLNPFYSPPPPNTEANDAKALNGFVKPDDLELPNPPKGAFWKLNVRGVLLLERSGQLVWPHEVFDLYQMRNDLTTLNNQITTAEESQIWRLEEMRDELSAQIEKVKAMFTYMEGVGNSIAMDASAFGSE